MSAAPEVIVHADAGALARDTAARLLAVLAHAQAERGAASVVLTGGGTGIAIAAAVRELGPSSEVDFSAVDVYLGDERWVPAADPERNDGQLRTALLDHLPFSPDRVHFYAAPDGPAGDDPEAAAVAYAEVIPEFFDVHLCGMGGEGHINSLFPHTPAVRETVGLVVAVHDCPKPPPDRVSLTLPAVARAREVWVVTTGAAKAEAIAQVMAVDSPVAAVDIPAAGARGITRTLLLVDTAAASLL